MRLIKKHDEIESKDLKVCFNVQTTKMEENSIVFKLVV